MFTCPKCAVNNWHPIIVYFAGSPVPSHLGKNKKGETVRWNATGTGLHDLTLTPSIQEESETCGAHFNITAGEIK